MKDFGRMLVATVSANVAACTGLIALVIGIALVAMGIPILWMVWAGAALTFVGIAMRYLLARKLRPAMDRISEEGVIPVYMPLLNQGPDVWRPVEAMKIGGLGYMVTESVPAGEDWAFQPGHILRCEERQLSDGTHLVAVAKAT